MFSILGGAFVAASWCIRYRLFGDGDTPDTYAYLLLGSDLVTNGTYRSDCVRDFFGVLGVPQPSRCFPPAWPAVVGILQRGAGVGVEAGVYANLAILLLTALAVAWIGGLTHPGRAWFVCGGAVGFAVLDRGYSEELAGGRSIPLAILCTLGSLGCVLGLARSSDGHWTRALALGCAAGFASLVRFDAVLWSHAVLALGAASRLAIGRRREAVEVLVIAGATSLAIQAPWLARNLVVFGAAWTSDNAVTAVALHPDIAQICWFEPDGLGRQLMDDPHAWLSQRFHYALRNGASMIRESNGVVLVALILGPLLWSRSQVTHRVLWAFTALCVAATLAGVSLTPYTDRRYWTGCALLGWLNLASAAATVAQAEGRRVEAIARWAAIGLAIAVVGACVVQVARAAGSARTWLLPSPNSRAAFYVHVERALATLDRRHMLLASADADASTFLCRVRSIYLPLNVREANADWRSWVAHWRPTHVLADAEKLKALGVDPRVHVTGNSWIGPIDEAGIREAARGGSRSTRRRDARVGATIPPAAATIPARP